MRCIDRTSPVPLYYQLAQGIRAAIAAGDLAPGLLLGNEIDLARELGLSRPTLRRALGYLVDRGLLLRRRGVGTVVMPTTISRTLGLTSLYDDLLQTDRRPRTIVLALRAVPAPPEVAEAMATGEGDPVTYLRRLRLVDEEPLAIMENYLPASMVRLERADLEQTGLYRLLRAAGIAPRIASQSIGARRAEPAEAKLLRIASGAPILALQRIGYDEGGRTVEFASHAYVAERHSFEMNLVEGGGGR